VNCTWLPGAPVSIIHGVGTGAEFRAVGHGNERRYDLASRFPDASTYGADGGGENAAEMDTVALTWLMEHRSAVAEADAGPCWRVPGGSGAAAAGA